MKPRLVRGPGLVLLAGCLAGCGEEVLPPSPPSGPVVQTLAIVSGNGQRGTVGTPLSQPLVVRLVNGSLPLVGMPVKWTASAGAGGFSAAGGMTLTGADGTASIGFLPAVSTTIGAGGTISWVTVQATVDVAGGPSVTFSFHVLGESPEVFIPFGPYFDCTGGMDPSRFSGPEGTIPVGSLVVWQYATWLYPGCAAQLRSTQVPQGAAPIESGPLAPGTLFGAVLRVAGDYVVEDVKYGGQVTLRVR
jgi:hypothetical protein